MISISKLKKKRGDFQISIEKFELDYNKIYSIVGKNGSGKTTILELILDLIKTDSGKIYIDGFDIAANDENWKKIVGAYINEDSLIGFLSPIEYLKFIAQIRNIDFIKVKKTIKDWESFLTLEIIHTKEYIRNLSSGQKAKIGIFSSFLGYPNYIILDEPFANLDEFSINILIEKLKFYVEDEKRSVLFSSHNSSIVDEIADVVFRIEEGTIVE